MARIGSKPAHAHKLKRYKPANGVPIFFCTLPDCQFKLEVSLALGKRSLCWRCGNEFLLDEEKLRLVRPHCNDCTRRKIKTPDGIKYVHTTPEVVPAVAADIIDKSVSEMKQQLNAITRELPDDDL